MSIEGLVALIPPPDNPIDSTGDWTVAEAEFGIRFPSDFRAMIQRYGTGEFFGLLVANPLSEWGRSRMHDLLNTYRELRDACEFPLILHPEKPGLFPWG